MMVIRILKFMTGRTDIHRTESFADLGLTYDCLCLVCRELCKRKNIRITTDEVVRLKTVDDLIKLFYAKI